VLLLLAPNYDSVGVDALKPPFVNEENMFVSLNMVGQIHGRKYHLLNKDSTKQWAFVNT